jgi:hypothetical protein
MSCLFCQKPIVRDVALRSDDSIVHAECLKRHNGWRAKQNDQRPRASRVEPLKKVPRWLVEAQVCSANSSSETERVDAGP